MLFFVYCKHYNSHIILPFCISFYSLHIWLALKNFILKNSFYIYWNVCHFQNFALLQVEPRFLVANHFISILRKPFRILIDKFWWLKIILSFAFFFFNILFFYWSIADLQSCVSFRCTANWFRCTANTHIYSFSDSFPYSLLQNI